MSKQRARWSLHSDVSLPEDGLTLADRFAKSKKSIAKTLSTEELQLDLIKKQRELKQQEKTKMRSFYNKTTGSKPGKTPVKQEATKPETFKLSGLQANGEGRRKDLTKMLGKAKVSVKASG